MKEHTKKLKEELNQNFLDKFCVSENSGIISISWKDGTALNKVKEIAEKYKKIYADKSGFKRKTLYINYRRNISDEAKETVKKKLRATTTLKDISEKDYLFTYWLWKTINTTDF